MAAIIMISKASVLAAVFSAWLLLLVLLADDAAAEPAGEAVAAAAWMIRRLDDTVEPEPLPAELDRVQRRVLQATSHYVAPSALNPDHQGCIQSCLPGSQYTVPPPGSHCDRKFYNQGC
uniref:Uncharacterized protein n=1 Tax=Oryza glumipatula TaxID=40148 RepID=A0A0D9ZJW5_9ORYZ